MTASSSSSCTTLFLFVYYLTTSCDFFPAFFGFSLEVAFSLFLSFVLLSLAWSCTLSTLIFLSLLLSLLLLRLSLVSCSGSFFTYFKIGNSVFIFSFLGFLILTAFVEVFEFGLIYDSCLTATSSFIIDFWF